MEAVKKAASGAVDSIRNSPLFRRKFGTSYQKAEEEEEQQQQRPLAPERDLTPFVQGIYFQVEYLGKDHVTTAAAQEHGCTDTPVQNLWSSIAQATVSIRVATASLRVKEVGAERVLFELPLFRVSYCGTGTLHKEAFSMVVKEADRRFYCHVFRCASADKAYALALSVAKAFYLAFQILQEEEGHFPPTPARETLFEPIKPDDTQTSPQRPVIPPSPPALRLQRPSQTSSLDSESLAQASCDEDFARLAKARSNPDILRSTLEYSAITDTSVALLHLHADPGSLAASPAGSSEDLAEHPGSAS